MATSETGFLSGLAAVAWPAFAAYAFYRLFPFIKSFLSRDKVSVKIAGMEISGEQLTDSLSRQIKDLQDKYLELEQRLVGEPSKGARDFAAPGTVAPPVAHSARPRRILWIDDKPEGNALQAQKLIQDGYEVTFAKTTDEGLHYATEQVFGLVISDMGRWEGMALYVPDAGLRLVQKLKEAKVAVPVILFTTSRALQAYGDLARELDVFGQTNSPVELYRLISTAFSPAI
jgi:CheY-like chemotaxis protein